MIGTLHHNGILGLSVGPRQAQCQIIGFAARIHKTNLGQGMGECCGQALGQLDNGGMEVAGIRVEGSDLLLDGLNDTSIPMSHVGDIVASVQVGTPLFVNQMASLSLSFE